MQKFGWLKLQVLVHMTDCRLLSIVITNIILVVPIFCVLSTNWSHAVLGTVYIASAFG